MSHIAIAKKYELNHWKRHRNEAYTRAKKMLNIFNFPDDCHVVADVGSGPRGGVFHVYKAPIMYAVDPLWDSYKKEKLAVIPKDVITITAEAESFILPKKSDLLISINALDHSGSLSKSIRNIMKNICDGGCFFFHIHMRTRKQLNKGHQMLITEDEIDDIFSSYHVLSKRVYNYCPIVKTKPYRSYVAEVQK